MLALALALSVVGQSSGWPARASDLSAEALARPENMPGDPDFAPRAGGPRGCGGQLELYGFTPACTTQIRASEREIGSGVAADRAWLLTRGRPAIAIAVIDGGAEWSDRELAGRWRLNAGELPAPRVAGSTRAHDANGDGAFTPLDYTSATGTTAPSSDRVTDPRLLARPDRGDVDGNGLLDPGDLWAVFGDGADGDANGRTDDVCGWDLIDADGNPARPAGAPNERAARIAAAEANNGLAGAGACPSCTVIPIRATTRDAARGELFAEAIAISGAAGAGVVLLATAPDYGTSALERAVTASPALVVAPAGDFGGLGRHTTLGSAAMVVSALDHDAVDRTLATTALAAARSAGLALERGLSAPGSSDGDAAALVAGVAGLALSAIDRAPPGEPSAGVLARLLEETATRPSLDEGAWSPALAAGRVNARAAVEAAIARRFPPDLVLIAPAAGSTLDPTPGLPVEVIGRVRAPSGRAARWELDVAIGAVPSGAAFSPLAVGELVGDGTVRATLPLAGLFEDPTAPPGPPLAFAVTVRLSASVGAGAETVRSEVRRVLWVHRDLNALPGFPRAVGGPIAAAPRMIDLDGDGADELVVATTDGALTTFDARGAVRSGWPVMVPGTLAATPAIAALVPGEAPSIVAITEGGTLVVLGADGAPRAGFPIELGARGGRFSGPAVADLDGDLRAEIVVTSQDGAMWLVGADGAIHAGFPLFGEGPLSAPAIAARAGIAVVRGDRLERWAIDGTRALDVPIGGGVSAAFRRPAPPGPVLGRNGQIFVAPLGSAPGVVLADGTLRASDALEPPRLGSISRFPASVVRLAVGSGELAVANVGGDGAPELVVAVAGDEGTRAVGAWSIDRREPLAAFPIEARLSAPFSPVILDLDADLRREVVYADDHQRLMAVSAEGLSPRGWPKLLPGPIAGGPAIGDLLGRGRWSIAAATAEGWLHAWRTEGLTDARAVWEGPRHDLASTGDVETPTVRRDVAGEASSCAAATGEPLGALLLAALAMGLRTRRRAR